MSPMSGVPSGPLVHEETAQITPLIQLDFSSRSKGQGTRIGGGIKCSFVILTMRHAPSRQVPLAHDRPENLSSNARLGALSGHCAMRAQRLQCASSHRHSV